MDDIVCEKQTKYEARPYIDEYGKEYWAPYNTMEKRFFLRPIIGMFKKKKACEAAIRFYQRCFHAVF